MRVSKSSALYGKERWRKRARAQLRQQPPCAMCLKQGLTVLATVADHVIPHHGDEQLFWFGKLQSLCAPHHNSSKKQIEARGFSTELWRRRNADRSLSSFSERRGGRVKKCTDIKARAPRSSKIGFVLRRDQSAGGGHVVKLMITNSSVARLVSS